MSEKTGRALEKVKYRVEFDSETNLHTIFMPVKKEWHVVSSHKKFRDAIKALNELRGIKK